jgi:hypothetical protein
MEMPTETDVRPVCSYELPGDAVFPESVGMDTATGDAYVASLALSRDRLLVVNGRLDKMGGRPQLPFTVIAIDIPEAQ